MPSRFTVPAISILEPARDLGQQRSCFIAVENESKPNLVPIARGLFGLRTDAQTTSGE